VYLGGVGVGLVGDHTPPPKEISMTPTLRIGHGNGHNQQSLVRWVRAADADSFSALEAQRLVPDLQRLRKHRVTVAGDGWSEEKDRARSTAILTRSKHESLGEFTRKVSERLKPYLKVAPDRVLVVSFYRHPIADACGKEGVAHFALHPDAGKALRATDATHPIVREYREALDSTREWMQAARRDGLLLFLTCDGQISKSIKRDWGPRPQIAEPLNLRAQAVGIDWILSDRAVKPIGGLETQQLYDHTGFVQEFRPKGRSQAASSARR
jgi:hypothetical protein